MAQLRTPNDFKSEGNPLKGQGRKSAKPAKDKTAAIERTIGVVEFHESRPSAFLIVAPYAVAL
jgi:hypothetical protein